MLNFCLVHLCMNIKLNPNLKFESLKMKREENRKQQQEKKHLGLISNVRPSAHVVFFRRSK
jgi:hypothetical protein